MTDHNCKCTHLKSEHHKRSILDLKPRCKLCPCNEFFRHNRPDNFDRVFAILGITAFILSLGIVVWTGVIAYIDMENAEGIEYQIIKLKIGLLIIGGIFIGTILWDTISDMINNNRRKDWNEE